MGLLDVNFTLPSPNITLTRGKLREFIGLSRRSMCYLQEHFTDYSITASDKHKRLRVLFEEQPNNLDELLRLAKELVDHCNQKLDAVFDETAKFLHEYFRLSGRDSPSCRPRICVKTAFQGMIVDLFRDRGRKVLYAFPIEENTGFESVVEDGKHYLCNDIPQSARIRGRYDNKRLDPQCVIEYTPPSKWARTFQRFSSDPCADPEWEKCWDVGKQRSDPESCYKSTLIIPMTLGRAGAKVSSDLRRVLKMDEAYEKSTYGYLCFDHRTTGYFRDPEDVDVGYFYADILSLYMINRMNYILNSGTFANVYGELYKAGKTTELQQFLPEGIDVNMEELFPLLKGGENHDDNL